MGTEIDFEKAYSAFMEEHLSVRTEERRRRLQEGHGYLERLFDRVLFQIVPVATGILLDAVGFRAMEVPGRLLPGAGRLLYAEASAEPHGIPPAARRRAARHRPRGRRRGINRPWTMSEGIW